MARQRASEQVEHRRAVFRPVARAIRHPGDVDVAKQIKVSTPFTLGAHDPGGHRTVIVARMDDGAEAGPEARPRPERGTGLGQGLISLRRMVSLSIHAGARSRPCCGEVMYAH